MVMAGKAPMLRITATGVILAGHPAGILLKAEGHSREVRGRVKPRDHVGRNVAAQQHQQADSQAALAECCFTAHDRSRGPKGRPQPY